MSQPEYESHLCLRKILQSSISKMGTLRHVGHVPANGSTCRLTANSPPFLGTSHCAQRRGPCGQDGPRMGWLCWSDTSATNQRSTKWAGKWGLCLGPGG